MSRLEDFEWMLRYLKTLDPVNAKIIEALGTNDPRNMSSLAKNIGLPPTTVSFRAKGLMKEGFLQVMAKLNASKLGLVKAVLIAEANRGLTSTLFKAIENVGYWSYIARCYGKFNGCYALFSFPFKYKVALEEYFERAKRVGAMSNYAFSWTTNVFEVAPNFDWFDFKRKAWNFRWQEWIDEILKSSGRLPQLLLDPTSHNVEVDHTDLLILKELEKNGFENFTQISKVAKITPQGVRHRFCEHVMKRNLVVEYEVAIFPYPLQASDLCAFVFEFQHEAVLAKFANSLAKKPFVRSFAKMLGRNSLLVHFYIPKVEFSNLMESLNLLIAKDIIQSFFYVNIDIPSFKRQTVSYEYFKGGEWVYDIDEQMEKLRRLQPQQLKAEALPGQ